MEMEWGMGLLTSAISKAEDKHRTGRTGQKGRGGQADGQSGWDKTGQGPIQGPIQHNLPYLLLALGKPGKVGDGQYFE